MDSNQKKTIFVKVGRMGGRIQELCLSEGLTVQDVLQTSKIGFSGFQEEIVFNGTPRTEGILRSVIADKDIILIQKKQVSRISLRIARINEPLETISVDKYTTVGQALTRANRYPSDNEEVWLHVDGEKEGKRIGFDVFVSEGYILVVEPKKDLRSKIMTIFRSMPGKVLDPGYVTTVLCEMLKKDYLIV
jgi:hypothetical protein